MVTLLIVVLCAFGYGLGGAVLFRVCEHRWEDEWNHHGGALQQTAILASLLWPFACLILLPRWMVLRVDAWREAHRPVEMPRPEAKSAYR